MFLTQRQILRYSAQTAIDTLTQSRLDPFPVLIHPSGTSLALFHSPFVFPLATRTASVAVSRRQKATMAAINRRKWSISYGLAALSYATAQSLTTTAPFLAQFFSTVLLIFTTTLFGRATEERTVCWSF